MTPKLYDADITNIKITTECITIPEPFTYDSIHIDWNKIKTRIYNNVTIDFADGSFLFVQTDKPINPNEYADFMSNNFECTTRFKFCLMFVAKFSGRKYGNLHMSNDVFSYTYCESKPESVYIDTYVDDGDVVISTIKFSYTETGWIDSFTIIFDNGKQIEVNVDLSKYDNLGRTINFFRYLEVIYDCIGNACQNSIEEIYNELKELLKYSAKEVNLK